MSRTVGKLLQCDRCISSVFLPWTGQGIEWSPNNDDSNFQEPPKGWGKGASYAHNGVISCKDLCPGCYDDYIKSQKKFWGFITTEAETK